MLRKTRWDTVSLRHQQQKKNKKYAHAGLVFGGIPHLGLDIHTQSGAPYEGTYIRMAVVAFGAHDGADLVDMGTDTVGAQSPVIPSAASLLE
jgi:hypothetical protein